MKEMPTEATGREKVDPITFEVVRHKLSAINEEQAITIRRVSGSPIVTDVADFNTGIYGPYGEVVAMGWHVGFKSGCMSGMIRTVVDSYHDNPGINQGDMFVLNDPYCGALHQPDVAVLAPVLYEDRIVAWVGADAHEIDVGGMAFGGLQMDAHDVQQEGLLLPGVKLVEHGRLREDIWRMIMGMVRIPPMVALDLKAMISANRIATRRMLEIIDKYGVQTVESVMRNEISASERQFRARLRSLPDGIFRSVDFIEHDGHRNNLYKIALSLEKRGDRLLVDMTGSSRQAPGPINCAMNGLRGAVMAGMLPILAPDIRWNDGVFSAVEISAPEASIVNAARPAPVSAATTNAMFQTHNAMQSAASLLAASLGETGRYAAPPAQGPFIVIIPNGLDRDGHPYGEVLGDSMAGGGGAYADHDGLDPGADFNIPQPAIGNVERYESSAPYLFLYRSLVPDSGGAGRSRGGVGIQFALTPHDTPVLNFTVNGTGQGVPEPGIMGGLEGGSAGVYYVDRANALGPVLGRVTDTASIGGAGGELKVLEPKVKAFPVKAGDIVAHVTFGGGGYGDPLDREPENVRRDVVNGMVSLDAAATVYGVIFAGAAVDEEATRKRRLEIRSRRLNGERATSEAPAGDAHPLGALRIDERGNIACRCGRSLAKPTEDWKPAALSRVVAAGEHGPCVNVRPDLEVREHVCPACGTLLESELLQKGEPSLPSFQLGERKLSSLASG